MKTPEELYDEAFDKALFIIETTASIEGKTIPPHLMEVLKTGIAAGLASAFHVVIDNLPALGGIDG